MNNKENQLISAMPSRIQPPGELSWVNPMRGIAILCIVLFHISQMNWTQWFIHSYQHFIIPYKEDDLSVAGLFHFSNWWQVLFAPWAMICNLGYQGVHIFLILSGFGLLLSWRRLMEQAPELTLFNIWRLWVCRRLVRIFPLLWIAISLALVLLFWLGPSRVFDFNFVGTRPPRWILLAIESAFGIHIWIESHMRSVNIALWFVGLLLQFYLFFPVLVWLLHRLGRIKFIIAMLMITAVSRFAGIFLLSDWNKDFAFGVFWGCRAAEFGLGMLLADYYLKEKKCWVPSRKILVLCVFGYIAALFSATNRVGAVMCDTYIAFTLFPLLYSFVMRKTHPVLARIGIYSLGIYLTHYVLQWPLTCVLWWYADNNNIAHYITVFFLDLFYLCLIGALFEWMWNKWVYRYSSDHDSSRVINRVVFSTAAILLIAAGIMVCCWVRAKCSFQELTGKALSGDSECQYALAYAYTCGGLGVKNDIEAAFYWAKQSAEKNCSSAQSWLGAYFSRKESRDYEQSLMWYQKAAEQNEPSGLCGLGLAYMYGRGVETNIVEARKYFEAAAAQNNDYARNYLMYLDNMQKKDKYKN